MQSILIWIIVALVTYTSITFSDFAINHNLKLKPLSASFSRMIIHENERLLADNPTDVTSIKEKVAANSHKILQNSPLESEAFLHLAVVSDRHLDNTRKLLAHANKLQPRNRETLRRLLNEEIISGKIPEALSILENLYTLNPSQRKSYRNILLPIIDEINFRPILIQRLAKNPSWANQVLEIKIDSVAKEDIFELEPLLNVAIDSEVNTIRRNRLIKKYTDRLISEGHFHKAESFWARNQKVDYHEHIDFNGLVNPKLLDLEMPGPFNWTQEKNKYVVTSFNRGDGFFVSFRGARDTTIVQQTFIWPNNNDLEVSVDTISKSDDGQGAFYILISCLTDGTIIKKHKITKNTRTQQFSIPNIDNKCPIAVFSLQGTPGIHPANIFIEINSMNINFIQNDKQGTEF